MNLVKKIFAALICTTIAIMPVFSLNANAATFSQINASSVFVKQQTDYTCTLAANVMMLRRTAMMRGDSDWASITENSCRSTLWYEGVGMLHAYKYKNISVSYHYVTGNSRSELIAALKEHPEGIAIYDWSRPHAILLTDYTDGTFYCSDPWWTCSSGRIPISQATISVDNIDAYWYVVSPDVKLTSSSTGTSGTTTSSSSISTVNETWKVTDSSGVNLRSNAGTSYSIIGFVPCNATVKVTKKTTNGGYTWGYVTYDSKTGWIALDYATKVTATSTNPSVSTVNETWKVTNSSGVNLRSNAGTSYSVIGFVPYNATVKVTKKTTNDGYTWGYVTYDSKTGWIVLDYATKVTTTSNNTNTSNKYQDTHLVFDNNSTISASEIILGGSVTLKGAADKGTAPYTYAYYYKKACSDTWTTIKNFSTSKSVSVEPLAATEYDVCIKVKDSKGNIEKKYMKLNVNKPLTNKSTISKTNLYVGDELTLKGKATGGIGSYSYAYYYKRHENESWTTLKDFCSDEIAVLKPVKDTTYDICIKVKDSAGNIDKVYKTVEVCQKLVNNSKISSNSVHVNDTVTLKGSASGGGGVYQYAYYYKRAEDSNWVTLYDFSHRTSASFKPLKNTTYDICIKVKDFYGRVEKKYFTLYVRK